MWAVAGCVSLVEPGTGKNNFVTAFSSGKGDVSQSSAETAV